MNENYENRTGNPHAKLVNDLLEADENVDQEDITYKESKVLEDPVTGFEYEANDEEIGLLKDKGWEEVEDENQENGLVEVGGHTTGGCLHKDEENGEKYNDSVNTVGGHPLGCWLEEK